MASVDNFMAALQDFGEDLSNMDNILLSISSGIVNDLKQAAPQDSGALKNSIQAVIEDNSIRIAMLEYGIFQNYGVDGMNQPIADEVPSFGIEPQPRTGNKFGFSGDYEMIGGSLPFGVRKSIYEKGLRPQHWFDLDIISERITREIANRLDI